MSELTLSHCVFGRRASSVSEVAAAVAEAAIAGVSASSAVQADSSLGTSQDGVSSSATEAGPSAAKLPATDAETDKALRQEASMHADQLAMRLALDVLWTGGGSGAAQEASQSSEGTGVLQ